MGEYKTLFYEFEEVDQKRSELGLVRGKSNQDGKEESC